MKTHYKKSQGKWSVFEDRQEKQPILIGIKTLWGAAVEWKRWLHLQELMLNPARPWFYSEGKTFADKVGDGTLTDTEIINHG